MPKIIKIKRPKSSVSSEESVKDFMAETMKKARERTKVIAIAVAAVLVVALAVGGYFMNENRTRAKAGQLFVTGYNQYYGLFENSALISFERYRLALDSFTKSYGVRKTPEALLYIAYSHYASGDYEDARTRLGEMKGQFPGDITFTPLALYKKAMAELKLGKDEDAVVTLEQLRMGRGGALDDLALIEAARINEYLGMDEKAREMYEALRNKYPGSPFYPEAILKLDSGGGGGGEASTGPIPALGVDGRLVAP